jgi:hypothetical protein
MVEVRVSETPVCDFCSDPNPVRVFQASDFIMDKSTATLPALGSRGGWTACEACGGFIDARNWERLRLRATDALSRKYQGIPGISRAMIKGIVDRAQKMFREHMRLDA